VAPRRLDWGNGSSRASVARRPFPQERVSLHSPRANGKESLAARLWSAPVSLIAGLMLALLALASRWLGLPFSMLRTLVHELGHAVTAWVFGRPAIPGFDLVWGGGITLHGEQKAWLLVPIFGAWIAVLYHLRARVRALIWAVMGLVTYALLALTLAHEVLILFMGHGSELLFGCLFLYRALSGQAVISPWERPLYATAGIYNVLSVAWFSLRLVLDPDYRWAYGMAKGGGHWMDLSRIADDYCQCPLETVAVALLLCSLVPVPLAVRLWRRSRPTKG